MDFAAKIATLARSSQSILDFTMEFCHLAICSPYDDETLKSLYWIGVNFQHPVDLPDTQGLCWKEAVIKCLESVYPRSIQPPQPDPETLLDLSPWLLHLRSFLTPALTFGHSTSPGSLGPLAQPGSDLTTPPLRTCGPSAALHPFGSG